VDKRLRSTQRECWLCAVGRRIELPATSARPRPGRIGQICIVKPVGIDDNWHHATTPCYPQTTFQTSLLAGNPRELPGQLLGRLPEKLTQDIDSLRSQASEHKGFPWLRPLGPSLTAPDASLVRTLQGHTDRVAAVASHARRSLRCLRLMG